MRRWKPHLPRQVTDVRKSSERLVDGYAKKKKYVPISLKLFAMAALLFGAAWQACADLPQDGIFYYRWLDDAVFGDPASWSTNKTQTRAELLGSPAVDRAPGEHDTAYFYRMSVTADRRLRLEEDAVISNFLYEVDAAADPGNLEFDLQGHTLTVMNGMNLKKPIEHTNGVFTIKNGSIDIIGTNVGTTTWGQWNDDHSGFFINKKQHDGGVIDLTLDNVRLSVTNWVTYKNENGGLVYSTPCAIKMKQSRNVFPLRKGHVVVKNGGVIDMPQLGIVGGSGMAGAVIKVTGAGSALLATNTAWDVMHDGEAVWNGVGLITLGSSTDDIRKVVTKTTVDNVEISITNDVPVAYEETRKVLIVENGAELHAHQMNLEHGAYVVFDGSTNTVGGGYNWGYTGTVKTGSTSPNHHANNAFLCVTNNALLLTGGNGNGVARLSFSGRSKMKVCDGGVVSNVAEYAWYRFGQYAPDTVVEVDGGTISSAWISFGSENGNGANVNCRLAVRGARARIEGIGDIFNEPGKMFFNDGASIDIEIPAEGFHDESGNARAPIYVGRSGYFAATPSNEETGSEMPKLTLSPDAFDHANPGKRVVLMEMTRTTEDANRANGTALLRHLAETADISAATPGGSVTVSEDGLRLIYTARRRGTVVSVR